MINRIVDPAKDSFGRIQQARRGQLPTSMLTEAESLKVEQRSPKAQRIFEAEFYKGKRATAEAEQKAYSVKKQQQFETRLRGGVSLADLEKHKGAVSAYDSLVPSTYDEEMMRRKTQTGVQKTTGFTLQEILGYEQGDKTGRMAHEIRMTVKDMTSAQIAAYNEVIKNDLKVAHKALWRMSMCVAASKYTQVYDPIALAEMEANPEDPRWADAVQNMGKLSGYFYAWQRDQAQGVEWDSLPDMLSNLAYHQLTPTPIDVLIDIGALHYGQVLTPEEAADFGITLDDNQTCQFQLVEGEISFSVTTQQYPQASGTNYDKYGNLVPVFAGTPTTTVARLDDYRKIDFANPQHRTAADWITYFTDIEPDEEFAASLKGLNPNTIITFQRVGNTLKIISTTDSTGMTRIYGEEGDADDMWVSKRGVTYTQAEMEGDAAAIKALEEQQASEFLKSGWKPLQVALVHNNNWNGMRTNIGVRDPDSDCGYDSTLLPDAVTVPAGKGYIPTDLPDNMKIEVDDNGREVLNVYGLGTGEVGDVGTEEIKDSYELPNIYDIYDDESLPSYIIKTVDANGVTNYQIDINQDAGFMHFVQNYPQEFFKLLKSMGDEGAHWDGETWVEATGPAFLMNELKWTASDVAAFYAKDNTATLLDPANMGSWSLLDHFKYGFQSISSASEKVASGASSAMSWYLKNAGADQELTNDIMSFMAIGVEGEMTGLNAVFVTIPQTIVEAPFSLTGSYQDRLWRENAVKSFKEHGPLAFFDKDVQQWVAESDTAPSWIKEGVQIAAMVIPVGVPLGVFKFMTKGRLPLMLRSVRTGGFEVIKSLKTWDEVALAAKYRGYGFVQTSIKREGVQKEYAVFANGERVYLQSVQEADLFFKTGSKTGWRFDWTNIFSDRNTFSFNLWKDGKIIQTFKLWDTTKTIELFETRFPKIDIIRANPLYKPNDINAILAAVQDEIAKGFKYRPTAYGARLTGIRPRDMFKFANLVERSINQNARNTINLYMQQIKAQLGNPMKTMKWKDGEWVEGIWGAREGVPLNKQGTYSLATNDVAQYYMYYIFDNPLVADYFKSVGELVDATTAFGRAHGLEFGRAEMYDALQMGRYFPRGSAGKKGLDILEGLKSKFGESRAFELQQYGLEAGFEYNTFEDAISSYIKSVYGLVARQERDKILELWIKEAGSETALGKMLIEGAIDAKAAVEKVAEFRALLKAIKQGKALMPSDIRKFREYFPDEVAELEDILNGVEVVTNIDKLDALLERMRGGGEVIGSDIAWIKRSGFNYKALEDALAARKGWKRSDITTVLEARRAVLNAINEHLRFPDITEVIESQAVVSEKRLAAIKEMKAIAERVLRGERIQGGLRKEIERLERYNLPHYRVPFPEIKKALEDYDRIRRAKSTVPEMNKLLDEFIDKEFSNIKVTAKTSSKRLNERFSELVDKTIGIEESVQKMSTMSRQARVDFMRSMRVQPQLGEAMGTDIKGFQGRIFKNQIVNGKEMTGAAIKKLVKKEFDPQIDRITNAIFKTSRGLVMFRATLDSSAPLTFGFYLLGADLKNLALGTPTASWATATGMSLLEMASPKAMAWYRGNNLGIYERYLPYGLTVADESSDLFQGIGYVRNAMDKVPFGKNAERVAMYPVNRANAAFSAFGEVGRVELIKSMEGTWFGLGGTRIGLVEYADLTMASIPHFASSTSVAKTTTAGILAFAPRFIEANLMYMWKMTQHGVMGRQLLKDYASSWAAWTAAYCALWYGSGQEGEPHLLPWEKDFMTIKHNGMVYGIPGFQPALLRTISTMVAVAAENPDKLIRFDKYKTQEIFSTWADVMMPSERAIGYKASPFVDYIRDLATGKNAIGQRIDGANQYAIEFGKMFFPIFLENIILDDMPATPESWAASFFGMKVHPESTYSVYQELGNKVAMSIPDSQLDSDLLIKKRNGTLTWNDVGTLQPYYKSINPDLQAAEDAYMADALMYKSDDYIENRDAKAEVVALRLEADAKAITALKDKADSKSNITAFLSYIKTGKIEDAAAKEQIKRDHPELYKALDEFFAADKDNASNFDIFVDEYYAVWAAADGAMGLDGEILDVQMAALHAKYKDEYFDMLYLMQKTRLKGQDPIIQRVWELKQTVEPYYKIDKLDTEAKEAFRKDPNNVEVEAALQFLGYTSISMNDDASELVKEWAKQLGIPENKFPALMAGMIPDEAIAKYKITDATLAKQYQDLPEKGYSRERFLIEHPDFSAYWFASESDFGLGHKTVDEDTGKSLIPTWENTPTEPEEGILDSYKGLKTSKARMIYRCQNQAAERVLVKFGKVTKSVYGSPKCKLIESTTEAEAMDFLGD